MKRALLLAGVLLVGLTGTARAEVIQTHQVIAKKKAEKWLSTDRGGHVYVLIYDHDGEVPQEWLSECKARYRSGTVRAVVEIKDCGRPGYHPYRIRYWSTGRPEALTFRLTTGVVQVSP